MTKKSSSSQSIPSSDPNQSELPPHLLELKQKNEQKSSLRNRKRQKILQKKKKKSTPASTATTTNAKSSRNATATRKKSHKPDKKPSQKSKRTKSSENAEKSEKTKSSSAPSLKGEAVDLSILKSQKKEKNAPTKKRKREILSDAVLEEFETKKRKLAQEEKKMTEASISLSHMKEHVLEHESSQATKVIPNALSQNVDLEVVYKKDISDPMDMPIVPPTETMEWLKQHFYTSKHRVNPAKFLMAKQLVRRFEPAYHFATLAKEDDVTPEVIVSGEEDLLSSEFPLSVKPASSNGSSKKQKKQRKVLLKRVKKNSARGAQSVTA